MKHTITPKVTANANLFKEWTVVAITTLIALAMLATAAAAQDYGQTVANPYGAPVVVQPTTNDSGIKVEDTKDTIKAPVRDTSNPTGQVTDEEFDGLVQGRDGR